MADEPVEPFDATDPAAISNAQRDAARIVRESADIIRGIMHTKAGRAWMLRQLDRCHINNTVFVAGQADQTAFNLGEESVGKDLLKDVMAASVDLYMTAIKEQQEELRRLADVRRTERKNREERERGPTAEDQVAHLPPPAGFPGGPPLPREPKDK